MGATQDLNVNANVDVDVNVTVPSLAIINRVAASEGVDPTELDPLYDAIDPDVLDTLVRTSGSRGSDLQVEFTYHGYDVTVTDEGVVHLDQNVDFDT